MDAASIGELAATHGIALHELSPQQASLEDAFFELTEGAVDYHAGASTLRERGGTTATPTADTSNEPDDAPRSAGRARPSLLLAVMRSEWTKLRSVRSTMWSLLATIAITVGFGSLFCAAFSARYDRLDPEERLTVDPTAAQSARAVPRRRSRSACSACS